MIPDKKVLPSFFTVLNLFFGLLAIVILLESNFEGAAWFIILAVLCDGMDGKLARLTRTESRFGFEMDSLADLVSFGVAPALFLYRWTFYDISLFGFLFIFLYLLAGVYRLARFNVVQAGDRSQGYIGLPIPVAAMCLAAFYLFQSHTWSNHVEIILIFLCLLLTVLMFSGIPYDWPKLLLHGNKWQKIGSIILLVCVILMAVFPNAFLFPALFAYVSLGFGRWIFAWLRGDVSGRAFYHPTRFL